MKLSGRLTEPHGRKKSMGRLKRPLKARETFAVEGIRGARAEQERRKVRRE